MSEKKKDVDSEEPSDFASNTDGQRSRQDLLGHSTLLNRDADKIEEATTQQEERVTPPEEDQCVNQQHSGQH